MAGAQHATNSTRSRWAIRLVLAVGALAVAVVVPAFACTPSADIELKPEEGQPGSTTQVEGRLFDPEGGPVKLWWDGANGELLATADASAQGTFSLQVTIPDSASAGAHSITATQRAADGNYYTAPASFRVTEPAQEPTQPADDPPADEGSEPSGEPEGSTDPATDPDGSTDPASEPEGSTDPATDPDGTTDPAGEPQSGTQTGSETTDHPPSGVAEEPGASPPQPATASDRQVTAPEAGDPAAAREPEVAADELATTQPQARVEHATDAGPLADVAAVPLAVEPAPASPPRVAYADRPTGDEASAWVVVPLALAGLGLFAAGTATFVNELRRRERAEI